MGKKSKALQAQKNRQAKLPSEVFKYKADNGKTYTLDLREKKFAEMYLEYEGNGTEAYIHSGYSVTNRRGEINRNLAKSGASRLLTRVDVFSYINGLLIREGFNSDNVDKQHLFLVNQHSDLSAKAKGIDMYNRLRGRYPKDQLEISIISKFKGMSDQELKEVIDGEVIKDEE